MAGHTSTLLEDYFIGKTVFLTGGTGVLGGCLLYKLTVELQVRKVFVLIRSKIKAESAWRNSLSDNINRIFDSGKIELVLGDITLPSFGISKDELDKISQETEIVINSAADISLGAKLASTISKNCLPPLELARMASKFSKLTCFVQISTAYVNCHLPDGRVEERIYPLGCAKEDLEQALLTGTTKSATKFLKPYTYAKHMMEELLTQYHPMLPLLIIRPSVIGSAARSPFPGYGAMAALPFESLCKMFLLSPGNRTFHVTPRGVAGDNIFDEIPVDWVANLTLLHIASETRGVVHAVSETWFPRTFGELLQSLRDDEQRLDVVFTEDRSREQCPVAKLFNFTCRDWNFEAERSRQFVDVDGPLSVDVSNIDLDVYDRVRRLKVKRDVEQARKATKAKL